MVQPSPLIIASLGVRFAAFQVVSAYTNTGTSLVDTSMVPFRTAYGMILPMFVLILAGNTAFPILFRLLMYVYVPSPPDVPP